MHAVLDKKKHQIVLCVSLYKRGRHGVKVAGLLELNLTLLLYGNVLL